MDDRTRLAFVACVPAAFADAFHVLTPLVRLDAISLGFVFGRVVPPLVLASLSAAFAQRLDLLDLTALGAPEKEVGAERNDLERGTPHAASNGRHTAQRTFLQGDAGEMTPATSSGS